MQGYPWEGKFQTMDEVRAYLDQTKVTCLLCGRKYVHLAVHIANGHDVSCDDYKERYGIPWSYGLAGKEFREFNIGLGKKLASEGKLPRVSRESIAKMHEGAKHRRPVNSVVRRAAGRRTLALHGRTEKWGPAELEEYLRRIASGRTPAEVSADDDMPSKKVFHDYRRTNREYDERFRKIWDSLPYAVHSRAGSPSKKFIREMITLRRQGLSWQEIGRRLGVNAHTCTSMWSLLKKRGKLSRRDLELTLPRYTPEDYEEYLRRIASGRTISDVGNDKDMPGSVLLYRYIKTHPEFGQKFIAMLDALPYSFQAHIGKLGKSFQRDVVRLREEGLAWPEIGQRLGVHQSTAKTAHRKSVQ